ncbi:MAG TPA: MFS transporter [Spirochaetota bacterium]|nr:MFS transporter [Spirochaetota bacterium]HOD15392.1 MFS transporter [Spirochaetota bacterium]HPG51570.1 MFS transporter [Spirochaetota bacterium]HPN11250.1 MFS transporter [Spirochaetota bacterium]HQL81432.1 MFS transporter [Spirochaetota bacterium]
MDSRGMTRGRVRYITFLSYISLLSYGLCISLAGPALGEIQRHFGVTGASAGLLFTAQSVGFLSTVLFGGYLADRAGLRPVILAGQALLAAGLALFAAAGSFTAAVAAYAVTGAAGGLIEIASNTLVSDLHPGTRVSSLNVLHIFFGLGGLAGPLVSGWMLSHGTGLAGPYYAAAGYSALAFLLLITGGVPSRIGTGAEQIDFKRAVSMLKSPFTILLAAATISYVGVEMGINAWSVLYLEQSLDMEKMAASTILANFWLAMTLGRIACAALGKKIGEKNLLALLALLACCTYALFLVSPTPALAGAGLVGTGLAFSGVFPALLAIGGNAYPRATATITGMSMTFSGIGFMVVPWLVGVVASATSITAGMGMLAALSVLLVTLAAIMRTRQE